MKPLNPAHGAYRAPQVAVIDEAICIGCMKCIQACPVDAIVGASKLMHTVIAALVHRLRAVPAALPGRLHRARAGGGAARRRTSRASATRSAPRASRATSAERAARLEAYE